MRCSKRHYRLSTRWSQYETVPSRAAPLDAPPPIARRTCRFPGFPGAHGARARWRSTDPLRADALWGPSWSLIRSAQSLSRSSIARLLSNLILLLVNALETSLGGVKWTLLDVLF